MRFDGEASAAKALERADADGVLAIGDDKVPAKVSLVTGDAEQEIIAKVGAVLLWKSDVDMGCMLL